LYEAQRQITVAQWEILQQEVGRVRHISKEPILEEGVEDKKTMGKAKKKKSKEGRNARAKAVELNGW